MSSVDWNMKKVPTISFAELKEMTATTGSHKVMKERWRKLLLEAGVFGDPRLMRKFTIALREFHQYLQDNHEYVDWDDMVWGTIENSVPDHWEFP